MRRCQRRTVPGVTSRCTRSQAGRTRIGAARTARSAQSSRGRELARRSTATSCRSTSSSASLEADERPSRTGQPQTRTKIRYSRRRDTADHHGPLLALPNRCSSQDGQTSASADSVLYIRGKGVGRRAGGACGGWVEGGKRSGRHDGSVYLPLSLVTAGAGGGGGHINLKAR